MFSNLIYLIIILLIYTTCQPSEETNFTLPVSLALFIGLIVIFAYYTWLRFQRLEKQIERQDFDHLDHKFDSIIDRQSVIAIMIFAINIYGLNLSSFLINIPVFSTIPTFQALVFLGLFVFYLTIIWFCAYGTYQKLNRISLSRRSYILSNISFSIPVLLPWLLLSGIADIINILPFEIPKRFLATTQGEIIYFFVFLAGIVIIGPVMIQKFWRCKPLETGQKRSRIEHLCKKAGMEYADILRWPMFGTRMITAGVMGLVKKFRYILVTDELLQLLDPKEIDAVIAHEIGHIKRKHLLYYLLFFAG
ncbi:MAG: M48 family metalloprotease, partial [Deltaproteobacteria bacterium]|nr:M48 family metalloprotease [Deltaproteobacteria bacterium]